MKRVKQAGRGRPEHLHVSLKVQRESEESKQCETQAEFFTFLHSGSGGLSASPQNGL